MILIPSTKERSVWFGRTVIPYEFTSPTSGEYALLLVIGDDDVSPDEQWRLSELFVRSGCRYAVCFGATSTTWDDSIDMVGVMDEVGGHPSPFVMTTWHEDEPIEETVDFFAEHARFEDWSTSEFVVVVLGGTEDLATQVKEAVSKRFC